MTNKVKGNSHYLVEESVGKSDEIFTKLHSAFQVEGPWLNKQVVTLYEKEGLLTQVHEVILGHAEIKMNPGTIINKNKLTIWRKEPEVDVIIKLKKVLNESWTYEDIKLLCKKNFLSQVREVVLEKAVIVPK